MNKRSGVCKVDGCEREARARGWCQMHYQRWKNTGHVEAARAWQRQGQCTVDGCERDAWSGGYCQMHRWRVRARGEPGPAGSIRPDQGAQGTCSADGCEKPRAKRSYCNMHYQRMRRTGTLGAAEPRVTVLAAKDPCSVDGCERPRKGKLYCHLHSERLRKTGDVGPAQPLRVKGAVKPGKDGYIRRAMPDGRRALEHVLVMEELLGRRLVDGENVHHKNGVRTDNRPGNLELWLVMQPAGQRVADLMAYIAEYHAGPMQELLRQKE